MTQRTSKKPAPRIVGRFIAARRADGTSCGVGWETADDIITIADGFPTRVEALACAKRLRKALKGKS
jgi:hypothetical protein